ncbi:uncharacterized protein LOC132306147 [Cornus florida]|uniref:uncharacterized protein LOC132306147 n=1 Tax=Cornus florida TaxID=4283 RepID=UPI002896B93F|nr:uncharacterized protein LOC132306147 [Cornus florida]
MKSRLGASISPLFTAQRKRSSFKSISSIPKFTLFNVDAYSNSLQLQGNESLKRSVHSSVYLSKKEDDEFSELGPPVAHGAKGLLKLVTEKPETFRKSDPARKLASGRSLNGKSSTSWEDILASKIRPSPAPCSSHDDVSSYPNKNKSASNLKGSRSITVQNVPSLIKLSHLIEAISIFGKISSASMRSVPNELDCCDVEFECVESSRRAASVGGITVKSFQLPIHAHLDAETVTIRIKNISSETTVPAIHSKCVSIGSLEGLSRAKNDAVDAFYSVQHELESQSILKKLNGTVINDCRWSANLLPSESSPLVMTDSEDAKCDIGLQISTRLAELKEEICMKKIYFEDLESLHAAIMHLEDHHAVSDTSSID